MLFAGKNITRNDDKLTKVTIDYLYHAIKEPKPEIQAKIRQLRIVRNLDPKRYASCKRELPYLVCGSFNPPFRRTDNFVSIEYFIIDIDHIEDKGLSINDIRKKLENDERVMLLFLSPSEDGLKVLFHLKEKCYDAGLYSAFYKNFVKRLSIEYNLEQVVDARTSDVCRACFVSHDPNIYINTNATAVDINQYIDLDNSFELTLTLKDKGSSQPEKSTNEQTTEKDKDPDSDAIKKIKEILKIQKTKVERNEVFVPEQLNDIIDDVKKTIEETGIIVKEVINISYGKKIRATLGIKQAEVNLFYGKKGYSVVKSPRCGTNPELNDIVYEIITCYLCQ